MRRFSIHGLMGIILAVSVIFAALRDANIWWAGGLLFLTLGGLGYAILRSIHGNAAWLGFLVGCGGYFLAVRTLPKEEVGWLPTSQALSYVEMRANGGLKITTTYEATGTTSPVVRFKPANPDMTLTAHSITFIDKATPTSPSRIPWATLLPGVRSPEEFRSIGQNLFALIFGWLGAMISRSPRVRQQRDSRI